MSYQLSPPEYLAINGISYKFTWVDTSGGNTIYRTEGPNGWMKNQNYEYSFSVTNAPVIGGSAITDIVWLAGYKPSDSTVLITNSASSTSYTGYMSTAYMPKFTYTITYSGTGNGIPSPQTGYYGSELYISSTIPTRGGYKFTGWNTAADGTGTWYYGGNYYYNNATSITLYAQWAPSTHYFEYNANGGVGEMANSTFYYTGQYQLSPCTFTREGYTFSHWNTSPDDSGSKYANSESGEVWWDYDVTLYAQWTLNQAYIAYHPNGGVLDGSTAYVIDIDYGFIDKNPNTGLPNYEPWLQTVDYGKTLAPLSPSNFGLSKPGYKFAGWKVKSSEKILTAGTQYDSTVYCQAESSSITTLNSQYVYCELHAQWEREGFLCFNQDGTYVKGIAWINDRGTWKKGIPWINANGTWKKGGN